MSTQLTDRIMLSRGGVLYKETLQAVKDLFGVGGSDPWTWVKLSANSSNSTTVLADSGNLSFNANANTDYLVQVVGAFQAAANTTGIAMALNIPSGSIIGLMLHTSNINSILGNEQIADDATTGVTTGVRAATTNVPILATYSISIGATGGAVQLRHRSEVASSAVTLQAGLTRLGYRIV